MQRRHVLALLGTSSLAFAGCIGSGMERDAVVRAVQKSAPENVTPISYDDLPQAEQQIARTAIEEGLYHACPELPGALQSFADRFKDSENAYLEYQDTSYGMWIRIEDMIQAVTASAPESDPSCGII